MGTTENDAYFASFWLDFHARHEDNAFDIQLNEDGDHCLS